MKRQPKLMAIAICLLLTSSGAFAESKHEQGHERHEQNRPMHAYNWMSSKFNWMVNHESQHERHQQVMMAPEISVSSGSSAIAMIIGVLLMASERSRLRRS